MKIEAEGRTEFSRFVNVLKKLLSVSREELQRRLDAEKEAKNNKRKPAKTSASRVPADEH